MRIIWEKPGLSFTMDKVPDEAFPQFMEAWLEQIVKAEKKND